MNRYLSPVEHILWLIDQAVPQNFVMVARITGPLAESHLRQALDIVQNIYPPLRCRIKEGKPPGFVSENVPGIPLRLIERKDDDHWIEEAEKEIRQPLPWIEGPFVRTALLTSKNQGKSDLLVTFCHLVADATSGVIVIRNVLRIIDNLLRGETSTQEEQPHLVLPSSIDLLRKDLKYRPEFLDIFGRIKRFFHKPVKPSGDVDVSPLKRNTRIIQRVLSPVVTKALVAKSKKEKTSVHGVLCAAMLQSVVEQIRKSQDVPKHGPLMIGCITPVNIRELFYQPVGDNIGNFISDADHYQLIDDGASIWDAAQKVKKALQKELTYRRDIKAIQHLGDFLETNRTPEDIARVVNQSFPPVAVTNMGRLDIPVQFGDLTLEQLHFALSINPAATGGFAMAVTNLEDHMVINFLYAVPYISKERATLMVESTMKRLKEAIK